MKECLMTHGQRVDVDDHEVKGHGEAHGGHQPDVAPGGHSHQGLVLRQAGGQRGTFTINHW